MCAYMCLWTCNNHFNWPKKLNWSTAQLNGHRQRLYTNTSTSYSVIWLIPICLLSVLHLCCCGWMGGICHIVIFLLLTSQFIRWLLGPWCTGVFSLPSLSFFSSPSLFANSKKTFNRTPTSKKHPFLILKTRKATLLFFKAGQWKEGKDDSS